MPAQNTVNSGTAYYSQHDTGPPLVRQLVNGDGTAINLLNADTVTITISHARYDHYYSPYPPIVLRGSCVITDAESGWVSWAPGSEDLHTPGAFQYIFEINWSDATRQTVPAHTYETLHVRTKPGGIEEP